MPIFIIFMYNLGYELDYNGTYYQFTVLMVFLNCTVNPFIYLIKYKDYQEALRKCLGCEKSKDEQDEKSNQTVSLSLSSISGSKNSHKQWIYMSSTCNISHCDPLSCDPKM